MKKKNAGKKNFKPEVYNLIILDRSGSMQSISNQAVAGVNETIGTIRAAGRSTGSAQRFTLTSFCSCCIRDHYVDVPIEEVAPFRNEDFNPCCCTPLYDAIGRCCTALRNRIYGRKDVAVSVTIITDGFENDSKEWNQKSVRTLIEGLKADGWLFAYIGANQDTAAVSYDLSISNHICFDATPSGTASMFSRQNRARTRWTQRIMSCCSASDMACCNEDYFDED